MPRLNECTGIFFVIIGAYLIRASKAFAPQSLFVRTSLSSSHISTSLGAKSDDDDDTISSSIVSILTSGVNFVMGDKVSKEIAAGKISSIYLLLILKR